MEWGGAKYCLHKYVVNRPEGALAVWDSILFVSLVDLVLIYIHYSGKFTIIIKTYSAE